MKKSNILIFALAAVVMLSGCNSGSNKTGEIKDQVENDVKQMADDITGNNRTSSPNVNGTVGNTGQNHQTVQGIQTGYTQQTVQGTGTGQSDMASPEKTTAPTAAKSGTTTTAPTAAKSEATTTANITTKSGSTTTTGTTKKNYKLSELRKMVNDFVKKVNKLSTDKTDKNDTKKYSTLKKEEDKIDKYLDKYEDRIENKYRKKTLSKDVYVKRKRKIENLEDKLDKAEDRLEDYFGIVD